MHSNQCFLPVHHCEEGLSRYGYLYDIDVEMLPTSESVIIDVLNEPASRLVAEASTYLDSFIEVDRGTNNNVLGCLAQALACLRSSKSASTLHSLPVSAEKCVVMTRMN